MPTMMLGVRAVIAASFERIHRSNLVGMGVLPLQFGEGQTRESLGLTGEEIYGVEGLSDAIEQGRRMAAIRMVRHRYRMSLALHQVVINEENIPTLVTAQNNVVRLTRNDDSGHARHADNLPLAGRKVNK